MIFPEHRTIFFHVGRTGGTSIERMLGSGAIDPWTPDMERLFGAHPEEGIYLQHATCETTLRLVGRERFDAYFKLTVVRNPFSRLVSVYYYALRELHRKYRSFHGYVRALPAINEDPRKRRGSHEIPQRHYTHIGERQVVDAILRFEELPGCIEPIRRRLGIAAELPALNKTRFESVTRKPLQAHYDAESVDIVRRVYADDFALFGYLETP